MKKVNPFKLKFDNSGDAVLSRKSDINQLYFDLYGSYNNYNELQNYFIKNSENEDKIAISYIFSISNMLENLNNFEIIGSSQIIEILKSTKPNINFNSDYVKAAYILLLLPIMRLFSTVGFSPVSIDNFLSVIFSDVVIGNSIIEDVAICQVMAYYNLRINTEFDDINKPIFTYITSKIRPLIHLSNELVLKHRVYAINYLLAEVQTDPEYGQSNIDKNLLILKSFTEINNTKLLEISALINYRINNPDVLSSPLYTQIYNDLLGVTINEIE